MRRRFGRGRAGPLRRMFGAIPPLLIRSNELLAAGRFGEAATGLEEVALLAEARRGPRAGRLYIEAGMAYILSAQSAKGMGLLQRGFQLLAESPFGGRAGRTGDRVVRDLRARGFNNEANQIGEFLGMLSTHVQESLPASQPSQPASRPPLPTHCPGCGAPMRSDELEWLDGISAECQYCGSPVRGD